MGLALASLERRAALDGNAIAIETPQREWSCSELLERAESWSAVLRRNRIRVLALLAGNSPDWVALDLAAGMSGCVLVPLPGFFSPEQIRHALTDSGAEAVVVEPAVSADLFASPVSALPVSELPCPSDGLRLLSLAAPAANAGLAKATARISYTSGTTGKPKGICLSQEATDAVAGSLVTATEAVAPMRHLCLLPLAVLLENIAGIHAPLISGATIVLPSLQDIGWQGSANLDGERLVGAILRSAAHSLILLPQMVGMLVARLESGLRLPDSLRFCAVGGAHVPEGLIERARRAGLPVFEGYGLTECASVVTLNTPQAMRPGSVGRPLPHVRVRIDERSGEILVAGAAPCAMTGEQQPAQGTGWFPTGDIGSIDGDGFVHIRGRLKNVFVTSYGRNVSPEWLEPEFLQSGSIRQIAIFGEARPWNVAVIVGREAASIDEIRSEVDRVNARLPDYARVQGVLLATEPFTARNGLVTANGRTRRDAVWRTYRERIDASYTAML